jgi:hypothetical protein
VPTAKSINDTKDELEERESTRQEEIKRRRLTEDLQGNRGLRDARIGRHDNIALRRVWGSLLGFIIKGAQGDSK